MAGDGAAPQGPGGRGIRLGLGAQPVPQIAFGHGGAMGAVQVNVLNSYHTFLE